MAKTIIDREIAALLPKLTAEETAQLEANLVAYGGARDKIITQRGTGVVVDGNQRLPLLRKHKLPFEVEEMDFKSRQELIQWVIDNQLGRRNLTDERLAYYIGKEYLNSKQDHGKQARFAGSCPSGQNVHLDKATAEKLAEKHGVNEKTVRRDAEFAEALDKIGVKDPEAKEEILNGQAGMTKAEVIKKAKPKPSEPKKPKPGQPLFDYKQVEEPFGKLLRAFDDCFLRAYPNKDDHAKARELLKPIEAFWGQWKARRK